MLKSAFFIRSKIIFFVPLKNKDEIAFRSIISSFLLLLLVASINVIAFVVISGKLVTPDVLKITLFCKVSYDIIISVHNGIKKVLPRELNYNLRYGQESKIG